MIKGSDLLVAALEHEGVDRIFGVPGEENLDVVESLRNSKIKLVLTRHEQAAAFMAATHGRLTGKPGVCIATLGPGALNFSTGAAYAYLGAMPMVMITGQKAIMSSRQARFQIVDVIAAMKPLTKLSRQIVSAASIPTLVRDAFRVAMEERPGPVHLELPEDIAGEKVGNVPMVPLHPIEIPVAHQKIALSIAIAGALVAPFFFGTYKARPEIWVPLTLGTPDPCRNAANSIADYVCRHPFPDDTDRIIAGAYKPDWPKYLIINVGAVAATFVSVFGLALLVPILIHGLAFLARRYWKWLNA